QAMRLVRALERATLLERNNAGARALEGWAPWLPYAGLLHFGTKDERYASAPAAARAFRERARSRPAPPPTKSSSGTRTLLPPPARLELPLTDSLESRRTWRRFGSTPISREDLATLLGMTWGVRQWARDDAGVRVAL